MAKIVKNVLTFFVLSLLLINSQGCSTDRAFVMKDLSRISPKIALDWNTAKIEKYWVTLGGKLVQSTTSAMDSWSRDRIPAMRGTPPPERDWGFVKDSQAAQRGIPDLGLLVLKKFISMAKKEVPGWPETTFDYFSEGDRQLPVLTIDVKDLWYGRTAVFGGRGFGSITEALMKDHSGQVLWRTRYIYWSDRTKTIEEFEADDFRILKDEIEQAAEKTAQYFLAHFKGKK